MDLSAKRVNEVSVLTQCANCSDFMTVILLLFCGPNADIDAKLLLILLGVLCSKIVKVLE